MAIRSTCRLKMLLVLPFLVLNPAPRFTAGAETLKSHECYQDFSAALAKVKDGIPKRFGQDWKMESVPSEIATELEWITKAAGQLSEKNSNLDSRASTLHADESELETATNWFKTRSGTLDGKYNDFESRWEAFTKQVEDYRARVQRHNDNRCSAQEDVYASVCGSYDAEKRALDAEGERLEQRKAGLLREESELEEQRNSLLKEAEQLAKRETALEQAQTNLNDNVSSYMESCEDATTRARALAEILDNGPVLEHAPERKPDPNEQVVKAYGQETVVQTFEHFVGPLLEGTKWAAVEDGPGIALAALDVANAGMDQRTKEIAGNVYLIGEYAMALKRLQQQGRLHAGEPGYEALEQMNKKLGREVPTSTGEFTWQSLTSLHTLMNGVAAAGGQYVSKVTEHLKLGDKIFSHLTSQQKRDWGRKGAAFFKPVLTRLIGGSSGLIAEEFLKAPHEVIKEQRQEWAERKIKE